MREILKSTRLRQVAYDVRGPALVEATRLEREGHKILKLNIGNPAPFGFEAPEKIIREMTENLSRAHGYSESKGIPAAREAIVRYNEEKGITGIDAEDIYTGNGVSELILMSMQAMLNEGDEVLIPTPDYPLWTASVRLVGGKAVHYICDEKSDWYPDLKDLESKITPKTRALVVINPNNPTGTNYPKEILEQLVKIAEEHHLVFLSDEIYDKILYDGQQNISPAALSDDLFFMTFNGLSKSYRIAGFRSGWLTLSGRKEYAKSLIEGLDVLSSMRLCSNVPAQLAIAKSLCGYQCIRDLVMGGGRLWAQRNLVYQLLNDIPGISTTKPQGAFYIFPRIDLERFPIKDDRQFVLDLLRTEKVLVAGGSAFNWSQPDHFRIVFLPEEAQLKEALRRIARFFSTYRRSLRAK